MKNMIGKFQKGYIPWNKGKEGIYSSNVLDSMSKKHKGKHHSPKTEFKKGNIPWNKGIKMGDLSEKQKEKIRKTMKGKMPKNIKILHSPENIKKALKRRIPTSLEDKFQSIINKYGLPYKYVGDGSFLIDKCNPDFININGEKIAIEVYARMFKNIGERTVTKWKQQRTRKFRKFGWNIIYFNEIETNEKNVLRTLAQKGGM